MSSRNAQYWKKVKEYDPERYRKHKLCDSKRKRDDRKEKATRREAGDKEEIKKWNDEKVKRREYNRRYYEKMVVTERTKRRKKRVRKETEQVSPAFLHANSTSHTWAFSAFAELIDNAYDPDVSASELLIDKLEINNHTCLIFLDNGAGMDTDKLLKMLSFGFCDKEIYERTASHMPIGHYGNGFKSGSMRLAKDALVFTRCPTSASIGFLSQTYLKAIEADSVFIPIVTYRLPKLERIKSEQSRNNLNAILKYSVFRTEQDLKEELDALEGSMTGTKIILSNLRTLQGGTLELDFSSDETDIRCPEAHEVDLTSVYHRPVQLPTSEYKHSLREYCSILFLRPRMKITIRGLRVKSKLISKSLSNTELDSYRPTWLNRPLKITFGFTCQKTKTEDYGMMLYHRNRLIKAFEKVGYQKQPNDLGIGVVGVAQVDFLQPTHNKQDFTKDEKFNSVMMAFAQKLNDYWNEKKEGTQLVSNHGREDWTWAQCEMCLKWRRLPDSIDKDSLPEQWYCRFNPDATHNRCEIPEEPEDEDLAVKPTYVKTYKRKREEKKKLELMHQQKQEIMERLRQEREVRNRTLSESVPVVNNLQRALAEAEQRKELDRRLITELQQKMLLMEAQLLGDQVQSKRIKKDQMVQPESSPGTSNQMIPSSKRKAEQDSSPNNAKQRVMEPPSYNNKVNKGNFSTRPLSSNEKNSNNSNKSSASSPMKVKIGALINKSANKSEPKNSTAKATNKFASSSTSPKSKSNETFVDLTEDIDYEITLNEDYDSDEDVKPDVNKLNAVAKRIEKKSESVDIKPDKHLLDQKVKGKVAKPTDKEKPGASKEILPDIKDELIEKDTSGTTADKSLSTASTNSSSPAVGNSNDIPETDASSHNLVSSNVNKVMAALENKFKQAMTNEKNSDNDKQLDNGENVVAEDRDGGKNKNSLPVDEQSNTAAEQHQSKIVEKEIVAGNGDASKNKSSLPVDKQSNTIEKETDVISKDCDEDIIEIDSDEDDFNLGGISIKKEIFEENAENKHEGKELVDESKTQKKMQSSYKEGSMTSVDEEGVEDMETQPLEPMENDTQSYESMETDSDQPLCHGKVGKKDSLPDGQNINDSAGCGVKAVDGTDGSNGVTDIGESMEGEEEESILNNKGVVSCSNTNNDERNDTVSPVSKENGVNSENEKNNTTAKNTDNLLTDSVHDKISNHSSMQTSRTDEGSSTSNKKVDSIAEEALQNKNTNVGEMPDVSGEVDAHGEGQDSPVKRELNTDEGFEASTEPNNENSDEKDKSGSKIKDNIGENTAEGCKASNENNEEKSDEEDQTVSEGKDNDDISENKNSKVTSPDSYAEDNEFGCDGFDDDDFSNMTNDEKRNEDDITSHGEKYSGNNAKDIQFENGASEPIHANRVNRNNDGVISKQRFQGFLNNVHHLLSLLCPDTSLGDVEDIEQTVQTMIQIHMEGSVSQSSTVENHSSS